MGRALTTLAFAGAAALAAGLAARAAIRRSRFEPLAGKVALVTGGSRGLGLELVRQLCQRGARVATCARDEAELRVAREICGQGRQVFAGVCDVTDPRQVQAFVEQVRGELGPIDVLINNAGVITVGPFETINRAEFKQSFGTHVSGPLEFIRAVLPDMRRRRGGGGGRVGGRIANVASIGGKVPVPHMAAYAASKHALVGLTESIRAELTREGIFVTLVCPGLMRTGSPWHARFKGEPEKEFAWFAAADNLPGLAIDPRRMAGRILDALEHGDAELTTPWSAKLAAGLHGTFSGITTELAGLQARLLPAGQRVGRDQRPIRGHEADVGQLPQPLKREQTKNAARYNEA